jgi:hypothetical protein
MQETINTVFFQISQKLNFSNTTAGNVYNPYKFEVIYKNYIFFSKYNNFKKSFKVLNNYWKNEYNFLVFSFFYSFCYHRFKSVQVILSKSGDLINFNFQEFFLYVFYRLSNAEINNLNFYINKPFYNLKNFSNLKADYKGLVAVYENAAQKTNIDKYTSIFKKYGFLGNFFFKNNIILSLKNISFNKVSNKSLFNLNKKLKIIFSNTFMYKYLGLDQIKTFTVYFLRKTRFFNKGRYSRNRQNYRTGVYWCLYVNIIAVLAIYYFFFRFSFNFGYFWWLFAAGLNCFFFSKFVKYKFYSFNNFNNNFNNLFKFYANIFESFKNLFFLSVRPGIFGIINKLNINFKKSRLNFYFLNLHYCVNKVFAV